MEENKINNKKILKYKQIKSLDIFSNIQSYDLTGINDYKFKKNFDDKNLLIKMNEILNNNNNVKNEKKEKERMNFIKGLIKKPDEILYDGYLCNRKKPSINYLLNKTKTKENSKFLEENILFKKPYPLIRYLSNRKIPNKSRQLITDILSAELNNLSVVQKIEMKYKPKKKLINLSKLEFPTISNISSNKSHDYSHKYLKTNPTFTVSKMPKNKKQNFGYKARTVAKDINLNGILDNFSTNKSSSNNQKKLIINLKKYKNDKINNNNFKSKEHATMTDNISFLKNNAYKTLKEDNMSHIVKDLSLLKLNRHLKPIKF